MKLARFSAERTKLLVKLESMIGNECYNGNIQNWGPGGQFEGEGREFRYPVTFKKSGGEIKRTIPDYTLPQEIVKTGYYKFGANELHIIRALDKILTHLETTYKFKV